MKVIKTMKWAGVLIACLALNAYAAEARLDIVTAHAHLSFPISRLLARSDVRTITIPDSEYKARLTRFRAIPLKDLFQGIAIPDDAVVQFNATDGFSANLEKSRLFNPDPKASAAFLAIEDPAHPWPPLAGKTASAGPFYLVWTDPEASAIGPEEWPYQIASFRIIADPRQAFPKIYPAADAPAAVRRGFDAFRRNCFACHRINGEGTGAIGPDLNLPMNPTEYLKAPALASLVRDPAAVRTWPRQTMKGFPKAVLPDAALADLIAYLEYMRAYKGRAPH